MGKPNVGPSVKKKPWRPEGWENPHGPPLSGYDRVFVLEHNPLEAAIYEAGADAMYISMLELIEKLGYKRVADDIRIYTRG